LESVICLKKEGGKTTHDAPYVTPKMKKTSHVLLCRNKSSKENFKKKLAEYLTPTLESNMTAPSLKKALLLILLKWREEETIKPSDHPQNFGIREAVRDQNIHLGWNNFVLGRWSPKWQKVQQQFYTQTNSKRTSKPIIHKLLLAVWDQWQFRNKIAHSDEGPIAQRLHHTLNSRISEEFQEDNTQLPVGDKYLFRAYTYLTLQAMPREDKQRWLEELKTTITPQLPTWQS
jgi:hypothetical protein